MAQKRVPWANSLSPARARSDGHHRLLKGPGLVGLWAPHQGFSGSQTLHCPTNRDEFHSLCTSVMLGL